MNLQPIPDFPALQTADAAHFPAHPEYPTAVLTCDYSDFPMLRQLADRHGSMLVVREVWRELLPQAGLLISSAISGGTIEQRFAEAVHAAPNRCWLLQEPIRMEFSLPCPSGIGNEITIIDYGQVFQSHALGCCYTHFIRDQRGFVRLWDTEDTLRKKAELAHAAGFCGCLYHTALP